MMHTRRQFMHHIGCASALGALSPLAAWAQTIDQLKIFYGFPAGSAGDSVARRVGEKLAATPHIRTPRWWIKAPRGGAALRWSRLNVSVRGMPCSSSWWQIAQRAVRPQFDNGSFTLRSTMALQPCARCVGNGRRVVPK